LAVLVFVSAMGRVNAGDALNAGDFDQVFMIMSWVGPPGSNTCGVYLNAQECQTYAYQNGLRWERSFSQPRSNWPRGCTRSVNNNLVYYNGHTTGGVSSGVQPICKSKCEDRIREWCADAKANHALCSFPRHLSACPETCGTCIEQACASLTAIADCQRDQQCECAAGTTNVDTCTCQRNSNDWNKTIRKREIEIKIIRLERRKNNLKGSKNRHNRSKITKQIEELTKELDELKNDEDADAERLLQESMDELFW